VVVLFKQLPSAVLPADYLCLRTWV